MEDRDPVDAVRAAVAALNDGDIQGYLGSFDCSSLRWVAGLDQPLSLADVSNGLKQLVTAFENLHLKRICSLATGNLLVRGGGWPGGTRWSISEFRPGEVHRRRDLRGLPDSRQPVGDNLDLRGPRPALSANRWPEGRGHVTPEIPARSCWIRR